MFSYFRSPKFKYNNFMNEHLESIFELLLPKLVEAGVDYWVFGGVSVAGMFGRFHRYNKDVDIFVKNADFRSTCSIVEALCQKSKHCPPDPETARPKFEVFDSNGKEVFSIIPIYPEDYSVILRYPSQYGGNQEFPIDLLEREERNVSGYRFFTSRNKYVKELFIKHMKTRPEKRLMMRSETFRKDAELLLTPLEIKEIEDYYLSVS